MNKTLYYIDWEIFHITRNSYLELMGSLIFNVELLKAFTFIFGRRNVLQIIAHWLRQENKTRIDENEYG